MLGKLDEGESLSPTEIASLHESADVGREELAEHFEGGRADDLDDGRVQSKVTDY